MKFWHSIVALFAVILVVFLVSQLPGPQPPSLVIFSNAELAGNSPAIGPENAKVTIVEFSDYQCPGCLAAEGIVDQLLKDYNGQIRFVYRNFPLFNIHPKAGISAEAALAAQEQGKFWEMHNALFENQQKIAAEGLPAIQAIAKQLGLNEQQFNDAISTHKFAPAVMTDFQDANKFKLKGTPTFFVNGKEYFGTIRSLAQFKQIVDAELAK